MKMNYDRSGSEVIGSIENSPYFDKELERRLSASDPTKISWERLRDNAQFKITSCKNSI